MTTPNAGIPEVPENTLDPAAGLNDALQVIDALLHPDGRRPHFSRVRADGGGGGGRTNTPFSAASPNSVSNTRRGGDRNLTIGNLNVNTQATDAPAIAGGINDALSGQWREAGSFFDAGVER